MTRTKIAIILTSHNREALIIETLKSIQEQTETNFHCFIIDDFSTDDTADVVKNFIKNDDRFFFHSKINGDNKGLSASRNIGLELIKGEDFEYIQFFDDDDIMHPKKLELQLKDLDDHPDTQFSLCGSKNFGDESEISWDERTTDFDKIENNLWDAYLVGELKFVAQVPLFRKRFFDSYKFDEDLFYAEEWVLFVQQFYMEKPKFLVNERVLFYRRKHDKSITSGGTRDFIVRKTSAIAGIKVLDFLSQNKIHSRISILHYLRYFLLYNYDSGILKDIEIEVKNNYPELMRRFRLAKRFHGIMRRIILRVLKY